MKSKLKKAISGIVKVATWIYKVATTEITTPWLTPLDLFNPAHHDESIDYSDLRRIQRRNQGRSHLHDNW